MMGGRWSEPDPLLGNLDKKMFKCKMQVCLFCPVTSEKLQGVKIKISLQTAYRT
jgi:hypothetical protein